MSDIFLTLKAAGQHELVIKKNLSLFVHYSGLKLPQQRINLSPKSKRRMVKLIITVLPT